MECLIDGLFLIDVTLNFLTAYYDDNNSLITDRTLIAKRYLRTWFAIDLISRYQYIYIYIYSLPIQIFDSSINMNKSVRLIRLQRIYRMAKLVKFMKMFNFRKQSKLYEKFLFMIKLHSGIFIYL